MDRIHSLLEWAATKGVSIRGIQPQTKTNCGIGMTATKNLKVLSVIAICIPTLGWESYADTQLHWSKAEIADKMHLRFA
ncbi:hypothetical protein MY11210_000945 [Beauveria gryllotalpidicola]